MDFDLSSEQRDLVRVCREFATEEIQPFVDDRRDEEWAGSQDERFPGPVLEAAEEVGLRLLNVPGRYGGDDFWPDVLTQSLMLQELAVADPAIALIFRTNWKMCTLLRQLPEPVQDEWFPRILDDESFVGGHALTEPKGSSDRLLPWNEPEGNLDTTAERDGDEWVIDGSKQFITNGYEADFYFVGVNTDPTAGVLDGTSLFFVPRETPGVEVTRAHETLGYRWDSNGEIHFSDVRVPEEYLLYHNTAFRETGEVVKGGRTKVASIMVGTARRAYDAAVEFAREHEQCGVPIIEHQLVKRRIAEMAVDLETAKTMAWRAAEAVDAGRDDAYSLELIARLKIAEAVFDVAKHAVEIHGGSGVMRDQGVEKFFRDAATNLHLHGTMDVHKLRLVNELVEGRRVGAHV